MLELRPSCEHCAKLLPVDSLDAMICTYECTFCRACAQNVFENVCPNCGGGFTDRPIRPSRHLEKDPASSKVVHKRKDLTTLRAYIAQYKDIPPEKR